MNGWQKLVLLVGMVAVVGMGVYPPWVLRVADWGDNFNHPGPPVTHSVPIGYAFITRQGRGALDIPRLMVQEAIAIIATTMGVLMFKTRRADCHWRGTETRRAVVAKDRGGNGGHESNQSPLNQQCLEALKALGLKPESQHPYCLQLAQWAVENNLARGPAAEFTVELLEQVKVMYGWKEPGKWFANPDSDDKLPRETSPQSLASELVENLFENLRQFRPELRTSE